jgi:NAD(P)-dependent dehydrogenase (short-subunit alcohol dehydrogenase family)
LYQFSVDPRNRFSHNDDTLSKVNSLFSPRFLKMAPNFDLKDKVIAITGASGGIGFATAQLLLAQGCKISIADVSADALATASKTLTAENHPGSFISEVVDVRKVSQVNGWIEKTVATYGKLDGAVNLAGVIPKNINIERVEEMNDEDWQFTIDVNLNGGQLSFFHFRLF